MHGHPVDADALLQHGEFVRALARRLVFDDDRVDDVVQETWLAALEHAPERPRSLRAWLARVVRNVAIKALRTDVRRRRREGDARGPLPPEPPHDAVDRLARGRQVVDAVLALDEPCRTTVVLRFYEDLEPKEIARRLGIPGATVRTRLKRGLDTLRARLDRGAGGRRAWCLALLPVLVPDKSLTGGILLMSAKTKLSLAAVLVLAAIGGTLLTWGGARGSRRSAERAASAAFAPPGAGSEGPSGTEAASAATERPPGALRAVVRVEDEAGVPVPGARVEAHRSWVMEVGIGYGSEDRLFAAADAPRPVATATADAAGVAVFLHEPRSAFMYRATKEGYAHADSERVELRERDPEPVTLRLGPAYPLAGRVLDEEGDPVAGAPVLAADPAFGSVVPDHRIPLRAVTGDDGSYRFESLPPREVAVWAAFPGGVPWRIATLRFPHVRSFDIVLERGGAVTGTVTDPDTGDPVFGARVRATGYFQHRAEAHTDGQGRYEIRSLPATVLSTIRVRKEGWYQVFGPGAEDQIGIRLGTGDSMRLDLAMRRAPLLRGAVRGPDGPLARTTVQVSNWWTTTGATFETKTDGEGRYSLSVAPGRFVVQIASRDLRIRGALDWSVRPDSAKGDESNVVDMPERGEVVRDFALDPADGLIDVRGRVVDRDGRPVEGALVGEALTAADGTFLTRGWKGLSVWAGKRGYAFGKSEPVEPGRDVEIVLAPLPALRGTVAARDGTAVEGPFVLVASEPETADAQERARLLGRLWLDARRVVAAGGRYEIRDLQPGRYRLRAGGQRHALSAPETVVVEASGERVHDFVLDAGESLRGRVVEAGTEAPVRGAWVHADDPSRDRSATPSEEIRVVAAVSGDDGAFAVNGLARGEYEIVAEARGYLLASVRAATGGTTSTIALEPALEIRGAATFPDGRPAAGLHVFAHRDGDTRERAYAPQTDAQGRFVVAALRRGNYRVTVGGRGALAVTSGPVKAGTEGLSLVVEEAEPGLADDYPDIQEGDAVLEGSAVDPSGEGIRDVRIYASPMTEKRELLGRRTRSGPGGRFVMKGLKAEAHRVRAVCEGTGLWQMKEGVMPGRDAPSFVFASLAGRILGDDVKGRELMVAPHPYDRENGVAIAEVLADGRFEIGGLPPGRYDLTLRMPKDRPQLLLEGGDGLEAGRTDLVLRATQGASIGGVVVDEAGRPIADATVAAYREGARDGAWVKSGDDGRFEISGLRRGVAYDVTASPPGKVPARLRVEAPAQSLRIAIETGFAASGRLLGADGSPIPGTRLRFVAQGHEGPERHAETDARGLFKVEGLRDGEYRVEMWPKVVLKAGDPMPEWRPVGTIRARDQDVELRMR